MTKAWLQHSNTQQRVRHSGRSIRVPLALVLAIACILAIAYVNLNLERILEPIDGSRKSLHAANHGVVASESKVCSQVGAEMLHRGGNAADAMISTVLCLGVIAMYHGGIGGGGFMLIRTSKGDYQGVDFRETAPAASVEDMFVENPELSLLGGLASGVPGELRGLEYLHQHYARLPWKQLFQPAIRLARHGFVVTSDLHDVMTQRGTSFLVDDPCWAQDFAPNGTLLPIGSIMTRTRYAETLEKIADQGSLVFYGGSIAEATIRQVQKVGGIMMLADLQQFRIDESDSLSTTYRGYRLTTTRAPSSGAVTLSILKTIEGYQEMNQENNLNLSTHRINEAMRFAYAERVRLGDPAFVSDLDAYQLAMIDEKSASYRRQQLSDSHTLDPSKYNTWGTVSIENNGTEAVVTMDTNGMTVSLTTTINSHWGSTVCIPETGVLMNNQMNDFGTPGTTDKFGLPAAPANFIRPGKRPLSSISPVIVEHADNHSAYLVLSVAGGSHIPSLTAWLLWHILDMNDTTAEALARPRLHDQLYPNLSQLSYTFDNSTAAYLMSLGHNVSYEMTGYAIGQAIRRTSDGKFDAASDPFLKAGGAAIT